MRSGLLGNLRNIAHPRGKYFAYSHVWRRPQLPGALVCGYDNVI
jgi:hypothetical protein